VLKVDAAAANIMIAIALVLATPFFIVFGWLSDRIGRKPIIMAGLLLAAGTYFPLFKALTWAANPALAAAQSSAPVTVVADPAFCSFQFDPIGKTKFDEHGCDVAKSFLARAGVSYVNSAAPAGTQASVQIGAVTVPVDDAFEAKAKSALAAAGYPEKAAPDEVDRPLVVAILFVLVLYVTMVYGPIAALLVELFPTRIRYTSMSLPYHIGNGWFGGFLPATAFAIVAARGNIYSGLWYPVSFAALSLAVGLLLLPETRARKLD